MEIFQELWHRVPVEWLIASILVIWVFGQTGLVQRVSRWHEKKTNTTAQERISERDQLSEDQQALIVSLGEQVEREREWRLGEYDHFQRQLVELRSEIVLLKAENADLQGRLAAKDIANHKLIEAITSSERGNSRLRHACNNLLQRVASLQVLMRRAGIPVPTYSDLDRLLGVDDMLDESVKKVFEDQGLLPPPKTDGQTA